MGHGNSKCSERLWMIIAIANAVSMSERSDLREASVSAVSARFEWSDYFWHILFHVGMLYLVVLSPFQHICILCSDVVGISMYRLFVMCILYFMYLRLKLGEGVLKKIIFWIKNILKAYILTLLIFPSLFPFPSNTKSPNYSMLNLSPPTAAGEIGKGWEICLPPINRQRTDRDGQATRFRRNIHK